MHRRSTTSQSLRLPTSRSVKTAGCWVHRCYSGRSYSLSERLEFHLHGCLRSLDEIARIHLADEHENQLRHREWLCRVGSSQIFFFADTMNRPARRRSRSEKHTCSFGTIATPTAAVTSKKFCETVRCDTGSHRTALRSNSPYQDSSTTPATGDAVVQGFVEDGEKAAGAGAMRSAVRGRAHSAARPIGMPCRRRCHAGRMNGQRAAG